MKKIAVVSLVLVISFSLLIVSNIQAEEGSSRVGEGDESWLIITDTNPITDEKEVGISSDPADKGPVNGAGWILIGKNFEFYDQDYDDYPVISYRWDEDVGDEFQLRFDEGEVQTKQVGQIVDSPEEFDYGLGLHLLKGEEQNVEEYRAKVKQLAKNMIKSESMAIAPVEDVDDYVVYDLTYFEEAIEPYLDKFGWEELGEYIQ